MDNNYNCVKTQDNPLEWLYLTLMELGNEDVISYYEFIKLTKEIVHDV